MGKSQENLVFVFDLDNPTFSNVDLFVPVFSFDSKSSYSYVNVWLC